MTTTDSATTPAAAAAAVPLHEDIGSKFLAAFATSLATKVTETLAEQYAAAKAAEEKAAKDAAAAEEEDAKAAAEAAKEKEKSKEEKAAKHVRTEDMTTDLYKIDAIRDPDSGDRKFVPWDDSRTRNPDDDNVPDEHSKWVLVLRRVFGYENELRKTKLDVKSPLIKDAIKEGCPPERAAMESEKASTLWPNDELFRYREHIRAAAEKQGELAVKHVAVLLQLIEKEYASRIHDIKYMFPKATTTYEILREAFWPGEAIVDTCSGLSRAYRIKAVDYVESCWNDEYYLNVEAEYIAHDGDNYGTIVEYFRVNRFKGVKYFTDLAVFPLKYHADEAAIRKNLVERGRKFVSLQGQNYKFHKGVTKTIEYCPRRVSVESRVMVDTETYNRLNSDFAVSVTSIASELVDGELTEEHLLLCTSVIPIFSFQDKQFYTASVCNISDVVFNDRVFDQLVLPAAQKELVRVLVQNHSKGAEFDDFVEGKGKGLVSVLHGPPGVGKTMTAEAVAEFTRRPLYIVTSGELGASPGAMETELQRVLDLAKTFRAVLLLDEADVLLEQRSTHDLVRNALVSIFLRQLEYYQGILFLTTNRVGTFDEAFHSRIHISLHYRSLTPAARETVWRNFGATMDVALVDADYCALAENPLNGRQIKNVFRTAQALAADKGERIDMAHMNTVLEVMKGFDLAQMKANCGTNGMET